MAVYRVYHSVMCTVCRVTRVHGCRSYVAVHSKAWDADHGLRCIIKMVHCHLQVITVQL